MTAGRPTREEAVLAMRRAIAEKGQLGFETAAVDAVAALFGGFAPSVVRVPVLAPGPMSVVVDAGVNAIVSEAVLRAALARSNAWHELYCSATAALASGTFLSCRDHVTAIRNLMSLPEMGIGPKNQK